MIRKILAGALALGISATASAAIAADKVKIGVITTLTTPAAVLGKEQMNGIDLAMENLGGKMGGLPVEIIAEDDGFKPDIGKQKADKLVDQDNVDIVTGVIWSNTLLAVKKPILDAGKFLIGANAGTSHVAGKECHKNFFSTSWQNDMVPKALGEVLNQRGVKSLYIMAPNYAAGKDMAAGVKSSFKGEIKGEDFTKWGKEAQLDFSAELAKANASGAEAMFVFYPGKAGGAFLKQFEQAGLVGKMQFYNVFTIDGLSLPKFQGGKMNSVVGALDTMQWSPDLDNEANKKFVAQYREKHKRYPSFYAAQAYDAINLINSAVVETGGKIEDKDAFRAALKKANYDSVRGKYSYGNNHFPIQNYYLRKVVEGADGQWTFKTEGTVYEMTGDDHAKDCSMK
jgi:branched-chain amino acid transport system substrate-binding protein